MEWDRTRLIAYLDNASEPVLYGRLVELRQRLADWLSYTPHTFPHYTRHTVAHSDEIVRQLSQLLFVEPDGSPVLDLSPAEVYCLAAAAYLHDAGMVVSDQDQLDLLNDQGWLHWIDEGAGATRFNEIQATAAGSGGDVVHGFINNLQLRFLIADYMRRQHARRSAQLLRMNRAFSDLLAANDPVMVRTVADICEGHGLEWQELRDDGRFPLRRDLAVGPVNVRLLAILLRIGDLLDMASDRACPLLLSASSPLPADSIAHWSQYQRIIHRLTAPDRIEVVAECVDQDEDRVLRDWLKWIADESVAAGVLLRGAPRHGGWIPPKATIDGDRPTLVVRPAPSASYVPSRWSLRVDEATVLQRFIHDAYSDPLDFALELLQNAADATRCVLGRRKRPRIDVRLELSSEVNESSGQAEEVCEIVVADSGIGMDSDVVENYLLQVGRSFYTTPRFRREFGFAAGSRFGVGFLSVFAVSDRVVVETFNPDSVDPAPLKVTLTGPRNYVLLDRSDKRTRGTTVRVRLRRPLAFDELVRKIQDSCRMLEFPVHIRGPKRAHVIVEHEDAATFDRGIIEFPPVEVYSFPVAGGLLVDALRIRTFAIETSRARGHWFMEEVRDANGVWRWDVGFATVASALELQPYPRAIPRGPEPLFCMHGLRVYPSKSRSNTSDAAMRLDYRTTQDELPITLNHKDWEWGSFPPDDPEIYGRMREILENHFASLDADWRYRCMVGSVINLPRKVLYSVPEAVRAATPSGLTFLSIGEVAALDSVALLTGDGGDDTLRQAEALSLAESKEITVLLEEDTVWEGNARIWVLEVARRPTGVLSSNRSNKAVVMSRLSVARSPFMEETFYFCRLGDSDDRTFLELVHSEVRTGVTWVNLASKGYSWLASLTNDAFGDGEIAYLHAWKRDHPSQVGLETSSIYRPFIAALAGMVRRSSYDRLPDRDRLAAVVAEVIGEFGTEDRTGAGDVSLEWQGRRLVWTGS